MSDDNVTPITRTHTCPSCQLEVEHEARFTIEAHGEECMQPEIRMRRVEHALLLLQREHNNMVDVVTKLIGERDELQTSLLALARHLLTPGECLQPDGGMACGGCDLCPNCSTSGQFHGTCGINETLISLLNEEAGRKKHGTSEASPDTQRSGEPVDNAKPYVGSTDHFCQGGQLLYVGCQACNPLVAPADAGPAEPERSPDAGADAAGEEPGRA